MRAGSPIVQDDLDNLARGAAVYFTLNPLSDEFVASGRNHFNNGDIVERRWLLIDIDPARDALFAHSMANESERRLAYELAAKVADYLGPFGFPDPIFVDSGNGFHLYLRISLPNDDLSMQVVSRTLKRIRKECTSAGADVDPKVYDAKRISKLAGTWVRKGIESEERPYRMAALLLAPEEVKVVSWELLSEFAGLSSQPVVIPFPAAPGPEITPTWAEGSGKQPAAPENGGPVIPPGEVNPWGLIIGHPSSTAYAEAALASELAKLGATTIRRNDQLFESAMKLGNFIGAGLLSEEVVRGNLTRVATMIGLGADGDPGEIFRAIQHGITAGRVRPREIPAGGLPVAPGAIQAGLTGRLIIRASEIQPKPVRWLWPDRLPIGKLTTFAGWGGLGKSFLCADLAARITTAGEIPGTDRRFELGSVLIVTAEDDPDDTTVPRLIEQGANLDRIAFLREEALAALTFDQLDFFNRVLDQCAELERLSLVVVDPVTSFLGRVDDHKNAQLKVLLAGLASVARARQVCVILLTHLNKPGQGKGEAIARVVGSVAWVNSVRACHMFTADPECASRTLFIPFKQNLGRKRKGLAFRIEETSTLARLIWETGEVETSADEALSRGPKAGVPYAEVLKWVRSLFSSALSKPSKEIFSEARAKGISERYLREAKAELDVGARRVTDDKGDTAWHWVVRNFL